MPSESLSNGHHPIAIGHTSSDVPQSDASLLALLLQRGCCREVARADRGTTAHAFRRAPRRGDRERCGAPVRSRNRHHAAGRAPGAAGIRRRYYEASLVAGQAIKSPADTEAYLRARLRDLPYEVFGCLFLDNRHRVLCFSELFRGTIDGTSVYPREVLMEALAVNAAAVILAHNHPSGVAEPSHADERITQRLKAALELVDIRLLDHLIVGDGASTSFASRGLL